MKQIKYLVIVSYIIGLVTFNSCLSSSVTDYSDDARIYSFSLKSDSVPAYAKRTFTVDHTGGSAYGVNGIIYNTDSLPFKTKLTGHFKAIPVISAYSSAAMFFNDTVSYKSGDSVDFSKKQILKNYADNGTTYKKYYIDLRVHKVQPDSIAWEKRIYPSYSFTETDQKSVYFNNLIHLFVNSGSNVYLYTTDRALTWTNSTTDLPASVPLQNMVALNKALYVVDNTGIILKSADGKSWTSISGVASPYTLKSLICAYDNKLFAIAMDNSNQYYIETSSDGTNWKEAGSINSIESYNNNDYATNKTGFPINNFAVTTFTPATGTAKILMVGGTAKNNKETRSVYAYSTASGKWADFANEIPMDSLPVRKNASVIWYDDRAMLYGGSDANNALIKDTLLCSKTEGLIWTRNDTLVNIPKVLNYKLRTKASVLVDSDNRIFLIGGKNGEGSSATFFKEAWVGRKNKLGFGKSPK